MGVPFLDLEMELTLDAPKYSQYLIQKQSKKDIFRYAQK